MIFASDIERNGVDDRMPFAFKSTHLNKTNSSYIAQNNLSKNLPI